MKKFLTDMYYFGDTFWLAWMFLSVVFSALVPWPFTWVCAGVAIHSYKMAMQK